MGVNRSRTEFVPYRFYFTTNTNVNCSLEESRACISTFHASLHYPRLATTSRALLTPSKCTRVTPHARQAAYMWQKLGDNPERAHDQHGALSPVNGYGAAPLDAGAAAHTRPHHSHPLLSHYLRYTFCLPHGCPSRQS